MNDAVAYFRCSGMGQVGGDTWERQRRAVYDYACNHDICILEEYRDEGVSGRTELQDRAGLAACMARVENNHIRIVLVESADRLARDLLVNELILREFHRAGAKVITASGVELTTEEDQNPTAKLVRQILAAIAEFDRSVIVLKLRAARERKRATGQRCEGKKPYGQLPGERETLDRMLSLAKEWPMKAVVAILNREGRFPRSGRPWNYRVVCKILNRQRRAA